MGCIFAILTCIYKDFDFQQVFEASPPKNLIFHVTSCVVYQKYVPKTVKFCFNRVFLCIAGLTDASKCMWNPKRQ